jgi:hypothetical protein
MINAVEVVMISDIKVEVEVEVAESLMLVQPSISVPVRLWLPAWPDETPTIILPLRRIHRSWLFLTVCIVSVVTVMVVIMWTVMNHRRRGRREGQVLVNAFGREGEKRGEPRKSSGHRV